jgi:ribosomal RNA assembly protein
MRLTGRLLVKLPKQSGFVRIPKERVGVLVGPDGKVKSHIEEKLMVSLNVNSEYGDVNIILGDDAADPSVLFRARDVVTAIGRGFAPERAFRLVRDEDAVLDVVDLRQIFGRSESDIKRVKGRIIGMQGKTRRLIEELSGADVVVYGHTIGIIGTFEQANTARTAVQMLIDGCQHHSVYRYLAKKRRELKKQKLELWEKPPEEK